MLFASSVVVVRAMLAINLLFLITSSAAPFSLIVKKFSSFDKKIASFCVIDNRGEKYGRFNSIIGSSMDC